MASASPRRKELLSQIGVRFECKPSLKEEIITKNKPTEVVEELSYMKAKDIAEQSDDSSIIIGSDTIVVLNDKILGKPKDIESAHKMISILQGASHFVYSGVTVIVKVNDRPDIMITFSERTKVFMYPMTEEQIREYISTGEPMDKAGSYAIQGKGAVFIEKIEGDYNNVVGLPIGRLFQELMKIGIDLRKI